MIQAHKAQSWGGGGVVEGGHEESPVRFKLRIVRASVRFNIAVDRDQRRAYIRKGENFSQ